MACTSDELKMTTFNTGKWDLLVSFQELKQDLGSSAQKL